MHSQPISKIQGINFFATPSACISNFENLHWSKKIISLIQSFGTFISYIFGRIYLAADKADPLVDSYTTTTPHKRKLVVCIHGLNNNPTQFKKLIDILETKNLSDTDIFIPRVLEKGNAKLDEMVKPIFKKIMRWTKTSENKDQELIFIGISNGGRIARAIEAKIATETNNVNIKKLQFISIVGACKGSSLVNLANSVGLSWLMSKNISEEMPKNSKRNLQLDRDYNKRLSQNFQRDYTFIASPHDWQVTNYDSSLMSVDGQNVRYAIVPNHGHNSIVNAVAKVVAEIIAP